MTNTEESKTEPKKKTKFGLRASRIFLFVLEIALFLVFVNNAYLILKGDFNYGTVGWAVVAFFYLVADAVRQGISLALASLPIYAGTADDTPKSGDA